MFRALFSVFSARNGVRGLLGRLVGVCTLGLLASGVHLHGAATAANVRVRLSRYVAVTPGYFGLFLPRRADGVQPQDNRARLALLLTLPLPGFSVGDRSLVERRFQEAGAATRYRNMLRVEDTVRLGHLRFTVYGADELFYDGPARRWTLNQAYLGLTCPFARRYMGEVLYSRQLSRQAPHSNLVQVAFSVQLNRLRLFAGRPAWQGTKLLLVEHLL